ncbi:hypothetical protein ACKI19_00705 [Streptomyces caniscabiei]|uniref:hypothetical protein n=1 Tax=Streptomyces caniscabiei TaxID=2746961 RepID=UPI0038F6ED53
MASLPDHPSFHEWIEENHAVLPEPAPIRPNRLLAEWATTRVWLLPGPGMRTRSRRISMGV